MAFVPLLWGQAAPAETITLRSGEHDGFSRLVLDHADPGGWALGRGGEGYVLSLERKDTDFDISGVYRLIPRNRLADIAPGRAAGTLQLVVRCDCHATAFETPSGRIVVDIADGPPTSGSPFERDLTPPTPPVAPVEWLPRQAAPVADPRLALFRRAVGPVEPMRRSAEAADAAANPARSGGHQPALPTTPAPAAPTRAAGAPVHFDNGATFAAIPRGASATRSPAPVADLPPRASADPAVFDPVAPTHQPAAMPNLPDPRIAETEAALLLQLSRAAAQGLVDPARPAPEMPHAKSAQDDDPAAPETAADALPEAPPATADHLAVHAWTSIDRDMQLPDPSGTVTANGMTCYPDQRVALSEWGDDRPVTIQIADRRASLVGEFDHPSPEAVLSLSRLYLHLGFGAEARAALDAFALTDEESQLLRDLAAIVDGGVPALSRPLSGMTDCDTAAALWAILAQRDLPADTIVDTNAVLRGFSALPAPLRRSLGGALADRFFAAGKLDAVRALRDAIARAPGAAGPTVGMIDARLDLAMGRTEAGEMALDRIANTNDALSPEALIMTIRSRIDRGEPVDPALAESAEALAFERRDSPQAAILDQAGILARASAGDFNRAFAALHRRWEGQTDATGDETMRSLFTMLAGSANDASFVQHGFADLPVWERAGPDVADRLIVAKRLADLGFAGETRRALVGAAAESDVGRRLLAEAALAEFDASRALAEIADLDDPASAALRARALALAGDHRAAAANFVRAGEIDAAADQAWRGADWHEVARIGGDDRREALRRLGRISADAPAAATADAQSAPDAAAMAAGDAAARQPASGTLASNRALLDQSRAIRDTIAGLLSAGSGAAEKQTTTTTTQTGAGG